MKIGRRDIQVLDAPNYLSLTNNFLATLGFIYSARRVLFTRGGYGLHSVGNLNWRLNFEPIQQIGPAAALVLAAELDRWTYLRGMPPRPLVETWQPHVQTVFHDLGLLPLLGLPQFQRPVAPGQSALKFLPFMRGQLTQGKDAEDLRSDLEELAGFRVSAPHAIYNAICEAMTNVMQHAYRYPDAAWPAPYMRCWWAAGAYNERAKTLHFFMYDQGVGIPRTLPKSGFWEQILALRLERTDADLIDGAIEVRRSSTARPGRGRGLDEIVSFIDAEGRGRLRIVSGNGEVCYMPAKARTRRTLPGRLIGTLIEWQITHD